MSVAALALALALYGDPTPGASDSVAVEYFAPPGGRLAGLGLVPYGDLRWRLDRVRDRPGAVGAGDLGLGRITVRAGLLWAPAAGHFGAEAGARGTFGSDQAGDPWAPVLNETADTLALDRLAVRVQTRSGSVTLTVGKQRSPLRLSEMIWDADLRPVGSALQARHELGAATTGRLALAAFARSRLDHDDARLGAAQASASFHDDAAAGGEAVLSWLHVESPKDLGRDLLQRQNAALATATGLVYAADFDLIDVQLGARAAISRVPFSVRLDLARNVAIPSERDGLRLRVALGGAGVPAGIEAGYVFQWIEREAVAGAFNSDDWWFHSRMRGHQVWMRAAWTDVVEIRLAGFHERREDLTTPTKRLTLELTGRLPRR